MACKEKSYTESDAKNKALHLTNQMRRHRPRTGTKYGQARAYYCKECVAWHVKHEPPKQVIIETPICPPSSYTHA